MLLWGVPVPQGSVEGKRLRAELIEILLARIVERPDCFTEPDVILDFGKRGLIIIETKLTSSKDEKAPEYGCGPSI